MVESQNITIEDDEDTLKIRYSALLEYHGGGAVFGATVGFRALQAAGRALSSQKIWNRKNIKVKSEHPGPGVKDAIEFVTRCVTRGGFQPPAETQCNSGMKFEWTVSAGKRSVTIRLRGGFLPHRFFALLDRLNQDKENPENRQEFDELKIQLSQALWEQPLDELFAIEYVENLNHA